MTATLNGKGRTNGRRRSAYPVPVEELVPKARRLAAELGELPSQNRLKATLRIGADKAAAVRRALEQAAVNGHVRTTADPADDRPQAAAETGADPATRTGDRSDPRIAPTTATRVTVPSASTQHMTRTGPATESGPEPTARTVPAVPRRTRHMRSWPVVLLALPAFISIWSGWVGLGGLTGFGVVHPLPGIWDGLSLNTAITLPVGMETYAAYALRVWLSPALPKPARRFAMWSAIGALLLGAAGQVAYHLMTAAQLTGAPAWITTTVACLPVAVLGVGAALAHLIRHSNHDYHDDQDDDTDGGAR
jgi:hypothetical protein